MAQTETYTGKDQVPHYADKTLEMASYAFLHRILTDGNLSGECLSFKRKFLCWFWLG